MRAVAKKIELAANIAIVIVALLLVSALVRNYLLPKTPTAQRAVASVLQPGSKILLSDVDWKGNGRTLIMALSTQCHFCTESAGFYQRLAQQRQKSGNIRMIAVFPQEASEGQKYLKGLSVFVDEVKQAQPDQLGVTGTPMLIMVDKEGAITDSWFGKLSEDKEAEVLGRMN